MPAAEEDQRYSCAAGERSLITTPGSTSIVQPGRRTQHIETVAAASGTRTANANGSARARAMNAVPDRSL